MNTRPVFQGDFGNPDDLAAYEAALRTWEAEQERERVVEFGRLVKAAEDRLERQPGMAELRRIAGQPIVLMGQGEPDATLGTAGNGYIDYTTAELWIKSSAGWTYLGVLGGAGRSGPPGPQGEQGPQGPQGPAGADGADGNDWRVGSGAPSLLAGDAEGDMYLDTASGDVYQVQSGAWVLVANITGPAGADGADGQGVPTGGDADEYLAKIDGTDFNTEWRPFNEVKLMRLTPGSGTQSYSTPTVITWSSATINVGGCFTFDNANDTIEVLEDGLYLVGFTLNTDTSTSMVMESRVREICALQRDDGSGFTNAYIVHMSEDSEFMDDQALNGLIPISLVAGDLLRLQIEKTQGNDNRQINQRNSHWWIMKLEPAGPPA